MPRAPRPRRFECPVVSETVEIRLTRQRSLSRPDRYFVQCDQLDCQYVELNAPPCPLRVEIFREEIAAAEAEREARRESLR